MLSELRKLSRKDKKAKLILDYYLDPKKTMREFLQDGEVTRKEYRTLVVKYKLPTKEEYNLEKEIDYLWDKTHIPIKEIATSMGISEVKARIYVRALELSKGEREITEQESEIMLEYESGKTIPEIAVEQGLSETGVHTILQGVDLRYSKDSQQLIKVRDGYYKEGYKKALEKTRCKPEIVTLLGLSKTDAWVVGLLEEVEGTDGLKYRGVWSKEHKVKQLYKSGTTIQDITVKTGVSRNTIKKMLE